MLHDMARGKSGRIVIEVDPKTKSDLYKTLAVENSTLKDWFLRMAGVYIEERNQPLLFKNPGKPFSAEGG